MAQASSGSALEPVSWEILGEDPASNAPDVLFARALLDSIDTLPEPCWAFEDVTARGTYWIVGKKTGTIYSGTPASDGTVEHWQKATT